MGGQGTWDRTKKLVELADFKVEGTRAKATGTAESGSEKGAHSSKARKGESIHNHMAAGSASEDGDYSQGEWVDLSEGGRSVWGYGLRLYTCGSALGLLWVFPGYDAVRVFPAVEWKQPYCAL